MPLVEPYIAVDPSRRFVRAGWGIVLCVLSAAVTSWLKSWLAGTLKIDESQMPLYQRIGCDSVAAVGLTGASVFFLKAWFLSAGRDLRSLLPIAVTLHLAAFAALPLTSNDIFSGIAYGREVWLGLNPFRDVPADLGSDPIVAFVGQTWINWQTCYGPLATVLTALVVWPSSVYGAVLSFKLAMLGCMLTAVCITYVFSRRWLPPQQAAQSCVLFAWNPLLAWEISGQAHNDGLLVLALTVFAWSAMRDRQWLAAWSLILGVYLKFAALPILGLYGVYVARQRLGQALLMAAALLAAGAILYAPYWDGVATLAPALQASTAHPDYLSNSLTWLACKVGTRFDPAAGPAIFRGMLYATRLVCLILAAVLVLRVRSFKRVMQDGFIFLLVFECLAMGWFQPWYASWLVPLAVGCGDVRLQRIAAIYTASIPVLYLEESGLYVGLVIVQVLPLILLIRRWRFLALTPAETIAFPTLTPD